MRFQNNPFSNKLDISGVGPNSTTSEYLTGNDGIAVPSDASYNIFVLGNNTQGINTTGNAGTNTLTIAGIDATNSQKGVIATASNAQAAAQTSTTVALTPGNITSLFSVTPLPASQGGTGLSSPAAHSLLVTNGSSAFTALGTATNGQIPIGSIGSDPVLATLTAGAGVTITNGPGTITVTASGAVGQTITGNSGGALSPTAGNWNILGSSTAAGTTPVSTSGAVSTLTVNVQKSQAIAATDATKVGLAAFNSAHFTVDANGFVSSSAVSSITLTGDTGGGLTGSSFTFNANTNCGSSVLFAGAVTTLSLEVTDANFNTLVGLSAGNLTLLGAGAAQNTGLGYLALNALTTGAGNTAIGFNVLPACTDGVSNVGIAASSLQRLTSGGGNLAIGVSSGSHITTGNFNVLLGATITRLTTGSSNILIGNGAGFNLQSSETGNIYIQHLGVLGESNTIRIGTQGSSGATQNVCYIAGVASVSVSNTQMVTIDTTTGQLGSQAAANVGTVTQFDVLVGGAAGAIASVGPGTSGQVLQSAGNAANPAYSTATYPATATGTGTLLRADGTNWAATTSTYPNTNAVSTLLYASSANVMSALATANRGVLTTGATGVPVITALATDGQLIIGSTAGAPAAATLTAGTGVTITNASNSITISTSGSGLTWGDSSGTFTAAVNHGYFITAASTTTLPASPSNGDVVSFVVDTASACTVTGNTGQPIRIGAAVSAAAGTAANNARGDTLNLVYRSTTTTWFAESVIGTWTVT